MAIVSKTTKKSSTGTRASKAARSSAAQAQPCELEKVIKIEQPASTELKSSSPSRAQNRKKVETKEVDNEMIAHRAWEIWQSEGCPDGRDLEHWAQAEQELTQRGR